MPDDGLPDAAPFERPAGGGLLAGDGRIAWLLGLGMLLLLVAVASATLTMFRVADDTDMVEHTLVVEATINRLAAYNEQVETARRGYLIEPSPGFRRTMEDARGRLRTELVSLGDLVSDNPTQGPRVTEIARLNDERNRLLSELFAAGTAQAAVTGEGTFESNRGVAIVRRIRALAAQMAETEAALLRERNQSQLTSLILLYVVGGIALALLIAVLGTVIHLVLRYNRSLNRAQDLLRRANEGLEAAVARRTAELQRANQEIQRFAYIVSHDLRSPLVNVLGFTAELDEARKTIHAYLAGLFEREPGVRDEAVWSAVEEDVPEALVFIRTSTEKMDRLINSILQLSRQGRRQLVPETLDMDQLVAGVIANLHQLAHDSGATVTAGPLPELQSDRMAVEQILSNLVENAIKYLSPARAGEIRIEGRRANHLVEIDVIDNGRGIAFHDHERIFELFRRSGAQDQPGEGIGLAHVRALAYRLGGTIDVESELDRGSMFRLSLPARFIATEQTHE
jgi:signal transduction histidine kinase